MSFFDEVRGAATTASSQVTKVLSGNSAVTQGIASATQSAESLKNAALSGLSNVGTNIAGLIPGLSNSVTSALGSIAAGQPTLDVKGYTSGFKASVPGTPPFPNVLNQYTSFNYMFTLSVLPLEHINDPNSTYRKGDLGPIIIKSAGAAPEKDLVSTAYGKYDFYVENLKISGMVGLNKGTGNSNALSMSFTVIEPYSMGLFFQAMQTAALQSGYLNYLDVPVLLTIEFKGHIDANLLNQQIDNTKKMIPLKLREIGMRVTGKGCTYDVEAYPWNEQAFSSSYSQTKTDVNISCNKGGPYTVQEMLQKGQKSLQKVLNDRLDEERKKGNKQFSDEVIILFPSDLATGDAAASADAAPNESADKPATAKPGDSASSGIFKKLGIGRGDNTTLVQLNAATVNNIGKSGMGFNLYNKGDTPFAKDNLAYDEATGIYKRGNVQIDPNNADFKFPQGSTVQDIINQVILMSDYGRQALNKSNWTPQGQVVWWRVETQYFMKSSPEDNKVGQKPKLIVYRVVPYLVDASVFIPPNDKAPGLENKKKEALKEYNYIYTGKNIDVLDFQIDFKAGFYRALNADGGKESESNQGMSAAQGAGTVKQEAQDGKNPSGSTPNTQETPVTNKTDKIGSASHKNGGTGVDDAATIAARQFHELATQGTDMINLNMTILGDPYYISDSGLGNYSAGATEKQNINTDGAMDYQTGEVLISVNFRTPIDLNTKTGFYNFGDTKPVQQFSGLFRVLQVESIFNRGKFTQQLSLVRIVGQDNKNAPEGEPALPKVAQPDQPDGEDAGADIAAIEAAAAEEYPDGAPQLSDQEVAANNAALGDFNG